MTVQDFKITRDYDIASSDRAGASSKPSLLLDFAGVKKLDPRITFTRATTATYYDGVTTAKAEENLLLQSQDFTSAAYLLTNATRTANTETAPDGTITADTLTDNATDAQHHIRQDVVIAINTTYVFSCFLKAGTNDYAILIVRDYTTGQRNFAAEFDLNAGTVNRTDVGTSGTLIDQSITSVGNGWYRCVIIGQIAAAGADTAIGISLSDGTSAFSNFGTVTYIGTGTTIHLWGAQLEQRSAVTAYTPTTTQPITNYIPTLLTAPAGVARFDHNPTTGESLGLLVEEQRTNLLLQSEDFSTTWATTRASVTTNTIVAPNGTLTGDKVVENTANGEHFVRQQFTGLVANTTYTTSVYVKSAGRNTRIRILDTDNVNNGYVALFNLSNATITSSGPIGAGTGGTATITPVGNDWYRCILSGNAGATCTKYILDIYCISNTDVIYTGDGYSGIYIWGAQLEAGAFPTSYIPTVAATVTRNADAASMTGTNFSSWYRADEGTLFMDVNVGQDITGITYWSFNDGTINNAINLLNNVAGTAGPYLNVNVGNVGQANVTLGAPVINQREQLSAAYKVNDFADSRNGSAVGTDTSGTLPVVDRALIGMNALSAGQINGTIKKLAYYPRRLTNIELQTLTTT